MRRSLAHRRPRWSTGGPAEGLLFEAGWFRIPSGSGKKDLKDFGIQCSGAAVFPLVLNFRSYPNAFFEPGSPLRWSSAAPAVAENFALTRTRRTCSNNSTLALQSNTAGFLDDDRTMGPLRAQMEQLIAALAAQANIEGARTGTARYLFKRTVPAVEGRLEDINAGGNRHGHRTVETRGNARNGGG